MDSAQAEVARHRTAIGRSTLSRPLRLALEADLLGPRGTVMDYGCGRGDDLRRLQRLGVDAVGWDPAHRPEGPRRPSDLVNLGYVLNVIENPVERVETLRAAWELALDCMVVAALVAVETSTKAVPYGDGVLTTRGTFQKYFEQQELEAFIRQYVEVEPVALGLGVFAVARTPAKRARLLARRFRHRPRSLPPQAARAMFEDNQAVLEPLVAFVEERGRFPARAETSAFQAVADRFGSIARATRLLQRAMPTEFWQRAVESAKADLLVYMALAHFGGRPRYSELDPDMQEDIRAHFGSYAKGVEQADALLFSLGQSGVLRSAANEATVGKLLPDGLYVHVDYLSQLPVVLRLFEGCARRYLGGVEDANLVKLRLDRPAISYLTYGDFWKDPHPALERSLQVDLQTFRVRIDDYATRASPPVLHRKELFIATDHPKYQMFARLTRQEEQRGLFDSPAHIGTKEAWNAVLQDRGVELRGHRLVTRKNPEDADKESRG